MKAAVVNGPGQVPVFADAPNPVPADDEVMVTMAAAAVSHLARGRSSGTHYSAARAFPLVAGVDGVGRLADGQRVYAVLPRAPHGTMAECTVVPKANCVPVPDGVDDVTAAALANPGMSSWAALSVRAKLRPGETVLVNGATGISGRLAVSIARHLGAGKVIATGRDAAALATLGADSTVVLEGDASALEAAFAAEARSGVDVVLDYLWGDSARALLVAAAKTARDGVPLRFVQIGSVTGGEIALPAAVLRSAAISLMGSGLGSVSLGEFIVAIADLLQAAASGGFQVTTRAMPLASVAEAWADVNSRHRIVLTMG